jgi:hypothetical protein
MMRRRACLTLLASFFAIAGCGDSGTGPDDISGRYELMTIDGVMLPFTTIQLGNEFPEVTSGFIQLNSDGTFTSSIIMSSTTAGSTQTVTESENGTWTQYGNQVTFTYFYVAVPIRTAIVSSNDIVWIDDNLSFMFQKLPASD